MDNIVNIIIPFTVGFGFSKCCQKLLNRASQNKFVIMKIIFYVQIKKEMNKNFVVFLSLLTYIYIFLFSSDL